MALESLRFRTTKSHHAQAESLRYEAPRHEGFGGIVGEV
jgi:hypothetical protein